jgi:hypothetical protein
MVCYYTGINILGVLGLKSPNISGVVGILGVFMNL